MTLLGTLPDSPGAVCCKLLRPTWFCRAPVPEILYDLLRHELGDGDRAILGFGAASPSARQSLGTLTSVGGDWAAIVVGLPASQRKAPTRRILGSDIRGDSVGTATPIERSLTQIDQPWCSRAPRTESPFQKTQFPIRPFFARAPHYGLNFLVADHSRRVG